MPTISRAAVVVLLALSGAGCGPDYAWQKAQSSEADQQQDTEDCERYTQSLARTFVRGLDAGSLYARCMTSRGYTLTATGTSTDPFASTPIYSVKPPRDATGRVYQDNDRAMCMYPNIGTVPRDAKACADGGGTITGPAIQ
jgi:hypothetical protein